MNTQQLLAKLKSFPLAIGLVTAALLMAGWTYWRGDALAEARATHDAKEIENKDITNNLNIATGLEEQVAQETADLKKLTDALIDPAQVIPNQQYFFGYERTTGVLIIDPAQGATIRSKDAAEPSITTFTLIAAGHWDDLVKFLYGLQTGPRLLRVSLLRLEKSEQQSSSGDINRLGLTLTVDILGK